MASHTNPAPPVAVAAAVVPAEGASPIESTAVHHGGAGGNGGNDATAAGRSHAQQHAAHEPSKFPWGALLLGLLGLAALVAIVSIYWPSDTGNKSPSVATNTTPARAPVLLPPPVVVAPPTPPPASAVADAPAPAPVINNYYYPQPAAPAPRHHRGARNAAGSVASAASQDPWAAELVQTPGTHADDLNRIRAEAQAKAHARFEGASRPLEAPNP